MTKKQKKMLIRILITAAMLVALYIIPVTGWLRLALYLATYLVIGYDILKKAGQGIANGRVFDENFLMAVATVGAFALAIYEKSGDYNEAIAVMLFYQVGELFQSLAVERSRKSIGTLMELRPDSARVFRNGDWEEVDPDEVEIGEKVLVRPGERVPLDGVVLEGDTLLDTMALTGEAMPRHAGVGDAVNSGVVNTSGVITLEVTKLFGDSTVARILELVENSADNKSKSEAFITRFARVYTPAVVVAAVLVAGRTAGYLCWAAIALLGLFLLLRRRTVRFETFGGTAIDSRKVRRGEKLTPPMLPVKEGAAFGGWFADQACTKLWSFDSDTVEKSMTLYAKWQ